MTIEQLNKLSDELSFSLVSGIDQIKDLTTLDFPRSESAVFIKNKRFLDSLLDYLKKNSGTHSLLALIDEDLWQGLDLSLQEYISKTLLGVWTCRDISLGMCVLSNYFYHQRLEQENNFVDGRQMGTTDIHPSCSIAQGVFIGERVKIGAFTTVYPGVRILSDAVIGDHCVLYPGVSIYPRVVIKESCRIHANTTIGSDGFGYHFHRGEHKKIWHFGGVEVGSNVEVGANSCIDGGTFSPTIIGDGTKIDNHVQVGHNCQIGQGVIICGHVAIGGSTKVGDFVVFGGKSGTGHDLKIASQSEIAGGALVNCDWNEPTRLGGHPARPLKEWMKGVAFVRKESLKKK